MNWIKASAAAEILSSIAILATLVYLAIEIQQIAVVDELISDTPVSERSAHITVFD